MDSEIAITMINRLVCAEVTVMKQINSRGKTTKSANQEEIRAASDLFEALTGRTPIDGELAQLIRV